MKLLFDENLSDRIAPEVADLFPGSAHVKAFGLLRTQDEVIWDSAKERGFTIVSKDTDFHQRSLLFGHPPRFVFLRVGNCSTEKVIQLLRESAGALLAFEADDEASLLILPGS